MLLLAGLQATRSEAGWRCQGSVFRSIERFVVHLAPGPGRMPFQFALVVDARPDIGRPLAVDVLDVGKPIAGNSVILKPASSTPLSAIRTAGLASEAGLPDGVLQVLPGSGGSLGCHLALHPDIDGLTFTGSTEVGKQLMRYSGESNLKRTFLELGGKSPNIVFADANLEKADMKGAFLKGAKLKGTILAKNKI